MDLPYNRRNHCLKAVLLLLLAICLGYSNTLGVGYFYDDLSNIVRNESLKSLATLNDVISGERPVGMITFSLNYALGGLDVTGYHIFNILIHILNSILAYFFLLKTFTLASREGDDLHRFRYTALLAALLFAVHPVQTQGVTYIVQRTEILSSTFMLLAMLSFALASTSPRTLARRAGFSLTLPLYLLGFLTKEIAITLPLLLIAYDFFFLSSGRAKRVLQRLPLHLALFSITAILTISKLTAFQNTKGGSAGFVLKSITSGEYLLTQSHVIWTYIRLIFFPFNQNLDYDYPISRSLFEPGTLISVITILGVFSALLLLFRNRRGRQYETSSLFFTLWFFIILLPTTSFIPILDVIYEHRLYLPSLGFFALASMAINSYTEKVSFSGRTGSINLTRKSLSALIVLLMITLTFFRNGVWSDPIALWKDTVSKSPKKARPYNNLGNAYMNGREYDRAIFWLKESIKADPMYMESHFNLGLCEIKKGDHMRALPYMEEVIRINAILKSGHFGVSYNRRLDLMAHANLGNLYSMRREYSKAIEHFNASLNIDPSNTSTMFNLGITYRKNQNRAKAIKTFEKILSIESNDQGARRNLVELINGVGPQ